MKKTVFFFVVLSIVFLKSCTTCDPVYRPGDEMTVIFYSGDDFQRSGVNNAYRTISFSVISALKNDTTIQFNYRNASSRDSTLLYTSIDSIKVSSALAAYRLLLNPDTNQVTYVFDYNDRTIDRGNDTLTVKYKQRLVTNEPSCDAHLQYLIDEVVYSTFTNVVVNYAEVERRNETEFLLNLYIYEEIE